MNPSERAVRRTPVPALVDRAPCRADTVHRQLELEERARIVVGGIFDRQPRDPGGHRRGDVVRDVGWHDCETVREVCIHRNINGLRHRVKMPHGFIERHVVVLATHRPGQP